jgi:predicted nucleotidyltransferase
MTEKTNFRLQRKPKARQLPSAERWYRGADIPMSIIHCYAREVAERFQPDKIILFGSQAYGQQHADSVVDILVVMPARNRIDQAVKIALQCDPPFPLDLIVRRPQDIADANSFLGEIVSKGKVIYEKRKLGHGFEKPKAT